MNSNSVNCIKCKHFFVTWDQKHPRGCKLFGFKTSKLPAVVVIEATGDTCKNFEIKDDRKL